MKKFLAIFLCLLCMVSVALPVSADGSYSSVSVNAAFTEGIYLSRSGNTISYSGSVSGSTVVGMYLTLSLHRMGVAVDSVSRAITGSSGYLSDTFAVTISTTSVYTVQLQGNIVFSNGTSETVYEVKSAIL